MRGRRREVHLRKHRPDKVRDGSSLKERIAPSVG